MRDDRDLARLRATYDDLLDPDAPPDLVRFLGALEAAHAAPAPPAPRHAPRARPRPPLTPPAPARDGRSPRPPGLPADPGPRPRSTPGHRRWARLAHAANVAAAAVLIFGLIVAAGLLLRGRATPGVRVGAGAGPAAGARLLYPGSLGGRPGIITAAADGGDARLLAAGGYDGVAPSPDGRRFLAYGTAGGARATAVADLYDADGRLLRSYALGAARPLIASWAPDARHVALYGRSGDAAVWEDGRFRTWLLDEQGEREVALGAQTHLGTPSGAGAWSAQGRLLLTVVPGDSDGDGRATGRDAQELWSVDATGGDPRRLYRGAHLALGWSPTGATVYAVAGGGQREASGRFTPGPTLLLVIDGRTGAERVLASADEVARQVRLAPPAESGLPALAAFWAFAAPALAPGGDRIALWLVPTDSREGTAVGDVPYLAVVDQAGRVVAQHRGEARALPRFTAWAPDGGRLAYSHTWGTAGSLAEVRVAVPAVDGAADPPAPPMASNLDATRAEAPSPRWSPEGRHLAFLRAGQVLVATGAGLTDVRTLPGTGSGWPAWQPGTAP